MTTKDNNTYEEALDKNKEELLKCQDSKKLNNCFNCEELLNCEIRKNYVIAAYESMSKGAIGNFDF